MVRRRPPEHIRHLVDLAYRIEKQSVELFEIRAVWGRPGETVESPTAKATYVRTRNVWRVFWRKADLKWHRYDRMPEVTSLPAFLDLVDADRYGSFWG